MNDGPGRIEQIAIGRRVVRVTGWLDAPAFAGSLSILLDGAAADADVVPSVSTTAGRKRFVAHVYVVTPNRAGSIAVVGPDGTVLSATDATRRVRLLPVGFIDNCQEGFATGWLCDPDLGADETAELVIDGLAPVPVLPLIDRQDVVAAGITPDPLVGFCVAVPWSIGDAARAPEQRAVRLMSRGIVVATATVMLQPRVPQPLVRAIASSRPDEVAPHRLASVRVGAHTTRPRILSVVAGAGGGTPQTNADLMRAIEPAFEPLILTSGPQSLRLDRIVGGEPAVVHDWQLSEPVTAEAHDSDSYRNYVVELLARERIDLVHIRHLAWHGLSLIAAAKAAGLPIVVSFHDYYAACPTVKLLDERNRFCGGNCTPGRGPCRAELWPVEALQPLKHVAVVPWRRMMSNALAQADHFVTTSVAARKLMLANLPQLAARPFDVIPHGRDFAEFRRHAGIPRSGERLKVLVLGNISPAKGAHVVAALAQDPRLEVHVLGEPAAFLTTADVVRHGTYDRDDVVRRIGEIGPHVGLIASIWPETHCHTLTELWAAGVPVVAFALGAVGERLGRCGGGWAIDGARTIDVVRMLHHLADEPGLVAAEADRVRVVQRDVLAAESTACMADRYAAIYRKLLAG